MSGVFDSETGPDDGVFSNTWDKPIADGHWSCTHMMVDGTWTDVGMHCSKCGKPCSAQGDNCFRTPPTPETGESRNE